MVWVVRVCRSGVCRGCVRCVERDVLSARGGAERGMCGAWWVLSAASSVFNAAHPEVIEMCVNACARGRSR